MTSPSQTDPIKSDFRNFLFLVWKHLRLPPPTPVQYDIAEYLQHGPRRSIIQAFRGVGKSWITSAYVIWRLYRNPQVKILVISASKQRADDFSIFTKRVIAEMPLLRHLVAKEGQRDSNVAFDVGPAMAAHAPSVKSVGITGQIVGSRADLIVGDDIEVLTNSLTQQMRDKLAEIVKEFDSVITPNGIIKYLGTPQTQETLYNTLETRGYVSRIWPARMPSDEKIVNYRGRLAPFILELGIPQGSPTDPLRFDDLDLTEREVSYGRSGFDLQFMLDTASSDANRYPLKLNDLIVSTVHPDVGPGFIVWGPDRKNRIDELPAVGLAGDYLYRPMAVSEERFPYTNRIMAIDPSGRGGDETGYAILFVLNGTMYLYKAGAVDGGYTTKALTELSMLAKEGKVNKIIIEDNFGDGMYTTLFKQVLNKIHPCMIEEVKQSMQKEVRIINDMEPVLNGHRLVVDHGCIVKDFEETKDRPRYGLFYQMTRLTKDKNSLVHDDRLDALSMAIKAAQTGVGVSQEDAYRAAQEAQLDDELRKFIDACHRTGNSNYINNKPLTWISK
jgi:hypothetical protein